MQAYEEAVDFINHIGKYSAHPGIENAAKLLAALDHPERELKIIHVAGTNGKGSVCAFLSDMLTGLGWRTGLFISPHLVDIRERIQLDRKMIEKEDFSSCFLMVNRAAKQLAQEGYDLTYFDYLFGIALCWYKKQAPDYIVMETGLGGRLDSTNAISSPLLTVITSISLDHTEILGDTIAKIAAEKAGIIKHGVPLIYCADETNACEIITKTARENKAPCIGIGRSNCKWISGEYADAALPDKKDSYRRSVTEQAPVDRLRFTFHLPKAQCHALTESFSNEIYTKIIENGICEILTVNSPALYQAENAAIAYTAALWISLLSSQTGAVAKHHADLEKSNLLPETTRATLKSALARSVWQGRFEQIMPDVYLDGAHNADGVRMLLASLRPLAAGQEVILLFTAVKEKDTDEMIRELCGSGLFCRYLITTVGGARAIKPEQLKETFQKYTDAPVTAYATPQEAFFTGLRLTGKTGEALPSQRGELLLCAGSLYLVGLIKELLSASSFTFPT